ncbi:MAG TPA: acetolactate synthase small subunit [Candidatus Borkfalkia excrementavium]|uniref:Acetolactate synthase small subunit n=1 Tax=Candidatus Borkfalkia excrementavium TaxID=2838505 RepID=A0A9D1Z7F9_9FIRM|nr:acetolactate synthase small subunit [Candidatus Borkfalkia excrementavium]
MDSTARKRWISLYVENDVGVLAKIAGLFSGKSYNLLSLTVGETEDPTVSRMTISLMGDDKTFEQIKKQLNRSVEVIKVLDFTDLPIHKKEILFIKIHSLKKDEMEEVFRSASVFGVSVSDYDKSSVILESVKTESENEDVLKYYKKYYLSRMEAVRGGAVAVESVSKSDR